MDLYEIVLAKALAGGGGGGGGGSSYTLLKREEHQVTLDSGTSDVATITIGESMKDLYGHKLFYVHIYDTEGVRDGYFLESHSWFFLKSGATGNITNKGFLLVSKLYGNITIKTNSYGLYPTKLNATDGSFAIAAAYSASSSGTIDSTYAVEIYALDIPGGTILDA